MEPTWVPTPTWISIFLRPAIGRWPIWLVAATLIILLILLVALLVYATGGTAYAYPYLILLPVLLAAAIFKIPGGVIAAVVAAIALGPWMPLDVASGTMQTTRNWLVRMLMYVILGGFAGALFTILSLRQRQALMRERIDPVTGLISPLAVTQLLPSPQGPSPVGFRPGYAVVVAFEGLGSVLRALGIDASNKAIRQIGRALNKTIGDQAIVTRIHGATFGILLPTGRRTIATLAARLEQRMPSTIPLEGFSIILLPRFGLAKLDDADFMGGQPFRKPMAALHIARERGSRVARYRGSIDRHAQDSLMLISDFNKALKDDEFSVYFQPKIELATGRIFGAEALIRWRSPLRGQVSPASFVPIIERTTLIDPMTRFVAQKSLETLAGWHAQGLKIELALNLSAILLQNPAFISFFKSLPQHYGIPAEMIEVEITETALMDDMLMMRRALEDLRNSGFTIAIDDFGTGYSSFKYLKNLPIQTVKLDQSFVRDLPQNKASCEISAATVSMCKRMNYKVIAEGVETGAAMEFLRAQGFDAGQGYFYAKPMPAESFFVWATSKAVTG